MRLAQMLMMDVKPLPDTRQNTWKRDTKTANKVVRGAAIKRYMKAIGTEWVSTCGVSDRLGLGRQSVFKQLVLYYEMDILERRPLGGKSFSARRGWEWRVK